MTKKITLGNKLRLYALLMRLQELQSERRMKAFLPEPLVITTEKTIFNEQINYDPVFYEKEPSKFFSKPKNNFKRR